MAKYLTTDSLITNIKRRASIPAVQSTFTDDDFIEFLNEEIKVGLLPLILAEHQDYLLMDTEIDLVDGVAGYTIPNRAIGNKVRDIFLKVGNDLQEMTRIDVENLAEYNNSSAYDNLYYLKNNQIILVNTPSSPVDTSLYIFYYIRPNELVAETEVGVVTGVNTSSGVVTLSQIPTGWGASSTFDLISIDSPFKHINIDLSGSINSIAKTVTFAAADVANLSVGDIVALSEETIVPQIPSELHVALAHRAAMRCLESMGDIQGLQAATAKLGEMENNVSNLIGNRVEGSPKKIVNTNSILRNKIKRV